MSKRKTKRQEENLFISNKRSKIEKSTLTDNMDTKQLELKQISINTEMKDDIKDDKNTHTGFSECIEWNTVDYIQEINNVDRHIAENIVQLFEQDNTIPFIARYRRGITGSMTPDQLRVIKDSYEQVKIIKHRATTVIRAIDKLGKWSPEVHSAITSAKSVADIEHIYSLYKTTTKRLAEKAIELGLGPISNAILHERQIPTVMSLIDEEKKGLRNKNEVINNIVYLTAHIICKDKKVFDRVFILRKTSIIEIHTILCKESNKKNSTDSDSKQKYEQYFDFKTTEKNIKPHQILAINRAASQNIIKVKIVIPDVFEQRFKKYCLSLYAHRKKVVNKMTDMHQYLLNESIDYAYKKMMKPLIKRRIKNELKERAETASIEVFTTNVKQLLLTPPVRGQVILGIDPGFRYGCKLAVISEHGDVLETVVIYPHNHSEKFQHTANRLVNLVNKHKCTVLALGNGTACRETEEFLTRIIRSKTFKLNDMTYTIVNESGTSIYSCSPEAKSEFPDLDPNLISAVSIARRLQDPLAELVKVEPKHLGVGMYQHDLPEKQLLNTLDEVITEAVSFVGVDINTASQCLLRRIAGLTDSKAANIINWRTNHGPFKNRKQLLKVKNIGSKTFEQCAGFIRILPETAMDGEKMANVKQKESKKSKLSSDDLNPLDQTWIHPESYAIANKFIKYCRCKPDDLGTLEFIEKIKSCAKKGCTELAAEMGTTEGTMEIIIEALTMEKYEDIRVKLSSPLFRNGMKSIEDLSIGSVLSGAVRNITHFGAFVDIGVGTNGLIHNTKMRDQTLYVGQRVEVKVMDIEPNRGRISLTIVKTL